MLHISIKGAFTIILPLDTAVSLFFYFIFFIYIFVLGVFIFLYKIDIIPFYSIPFFRVLCTFVEIIPAFFFMPAKALLSKTWTKRFVIYSFFLFPLFPPDAPLKDQSFLVLFYMMRLRT